MIARWWCMPLIPAGGGRRITVELETSMVYRANSRTQKPCLEKRNQKKDICTNKIFKFL